MNAAECSAVSVQCSDRLVDWRTVEVEVLPSRPS